MKIIRLTEKQLREAYDGDFEYISDDPTRQYGGNTYVTSAGKMDDEEFGNPKYTDELDVMAPNGYWYGWHYRNAPIHENTHGDSQEEYSNPQKRDMDNNTETIDVFQDNDPTNVNTVIPQSVIHHMQLFLDAIKTANLPSNKQSMIVKELMKQMNLKTDPSWVASERRTASDEGKRIINNKK